MHTDMKRILFAFAMLAASLMTMISCEEVGDTAEITISDAESQELFNSGISFSATPAEGSLTATVSFTSTLDWTVSVEDANETKAPAWLTASPASGSAGPAVLTITAQENESEDARSAQVTIHCGDVSQSVTVTQAGKESDTPTFTVKLDKTEVEMTVGEVLQLIAEITPPDPVARQISWSSFDTQVATVTTGDDVDVTGVPIPGGIVTAVGVGEAIITAKAGDSEATCKVIVKEGSSTTEETFAIIPSPVTLTIDQEEVLTAVMLPSNTEVKVEWKCSNPDIVALGAITDSKAKVQGLSEGKATVTAYAEGGKTATCEVTVEGGSSTIIPVESITLDKTELELAVGEKYQLVATILPENATYRGENDLEWTTTDPYGVYVNGGLVTAYRVGEATITCTSRSNREVSATCHVRVTQTGGGGGGGTTVESASVDPSSVTIQLDEEKVLTLVTVPADAEVTIYWESANQYIASVQMISKMQAKVKGISVGETTLTVHAGDKTATCQVKVEDPSGTNIPVESVTLNEHELSMNVNTQFQLVATVLPENATNKEVVWSSNVQSSKLYIDVNGMLTALQACEATITVRCKANAYIYDTCHVVVTGSSSGGSDEEVVDLGLPSGLKWRSMNVGASKPEDYGNYYAWGETTTKSSYSWSNYKYSSSDIYGDGVGKTGKKVLIPEDDAATANLGNGWRTPKNSEWKELINNCTWKWTTRNGVNGMLLTGPNGKSIFLPAAGYYRPSLTNRGSYGSYWSSSYGSDENALAWDFINTDFSAAYLVRSQGCSVRPVKD